MNNPNLIIETQKEIRLENGYRPLIDLFLPQLNIAIEVDEDYHANEAQHNHDVWREKSINSQISKPCIGDSIQFERVKAYNVSLEEINERIDEIVKLIKNRIASRATPLVWKSKEELLDDIKKRGTISMDDCFDSNVQIINLVYNRNYSGWQKSTYRLLWFPVISEIDKDGILTSRASWQNFFNQTHSIIYERVDNSSLNERKKEWALADEQNGAVRVIFVKDRDSFGKNRKRFAGVFVASGWDDNLNAQVWKLERTKIRIPLNEEEFKNL